MRESYVFGTPRAAALVALVSLGCGLSTAAPSDDRHERVGVSQSAIIGGDPSTSEDDHVVFLSHAGEQNFLGCGAALIAPNLVVTAKHCLYEYVQANSICDASGEPQPGSAGGFVTTPIPVRNIGMYARGDAKKRFIDGEQPAAVGKQVIDDNSAALCSHDIAYLVLDQPMTGVPIAPMRLHKRPAVGGVVAVAGWGQVEDRINTRYRQRRTGISIRRVGEPVVPPNPVGSLGPRTFETGPGACSGDSGSPGYDLQTRAVLGVVARALDIDLNDPISPCRPESVTVVYINVADSPKELRSAFAAAKAEPWLEGRPSPGYVRFGEACTADLECAGGRCAGGTCNVDCAKPNSACPTGYVCGSSGTCQSAPATPAPAPTASTTAPGPGGPNAEPEPEATVSSCATTPFPARDVSPWLLGVSAVLAWGMRVSRRRRSLP